MISSAMRRARAPSRRSRTAAASRTDSAVAKPTVALVNNAQREHQEFMASVEAVARENGAVLQALAPTGTAVFPAGEEFTALWTQLAGARACLTFGSQGADIGLAGTEWHEG